MRKLDADEIAKEPIFEILNLPAFDLWRLAAERPKAPAVIKQDFGDVGALSVEFDHLASGAFEFLLEGDGQRERFVICGGMSEESASESANGVARESKTSESAQKGRAAFLIAAWSGFAVRDMAWIGDLGHGWPPRWDGEDRVVWERRSVKESGVVGG